MTGATGFVGKKLCEILLKKNNDLVILSRKIPKNSGNSSIHYYQWDYKSDNFPEASLDGIDSVIHLMGESVSSRWTEERKKEILLSRTLSSQKLIYHLKQSQLKSGTKIESFISTSAVGIYGDRGDDEIDENSEAHDIKSKDFLAGICLEWEKSVLAATEVAKRVAIIRVGIVLGAGGGALEKMLLPFKLNAGGILGSGKQWMSWIHIQDLATLYQSILLKPMMKGIYNGTSPNPVTNKQFTEILAKSLGRVAILPTPAFALKLLFGEMSSILLTGQRVFPRKALADGFTFQFPKLQEALQQILKDEK